MQQRDCQSQKILRDGLEKRKKTPPKIFSLFLHFPSTRIEVYLFYIIQLALLKNTNVGQING